MKKIIESVITAIVVGVVSFILSGLLSLLSLKYGSIIANEPINIENDTYLSVIDIINNSDNILKDIGIELPGKLVEINSNIPIDYTVENYSSGDNSKIVVNTANEHSNYQILVKYEKSVESEIVISNYKPNKLTLTDKEDYLNPMKSTISILIYTSISYAIMIGIMYYYYNRKREKQINEIDKRNDDLKYSIESINNINNNTEKRLDDTIKDLKQKRDHDTKLRLLYLARISDYKKELSFWRDTVRKTINNHTKADDVIDEVTKTLKTYKTLEKFENNEFQYLEIAELILDDKNKKTD